MSELTTEHGTEPNNQAILELPLPSITIDGRDLAVDIVRTLGTVRIRQEASAPAVCELELDVTTALTAPAPGMPLRVRIDGAEDVFSGEIVAISHRLGPDGIHRLRLRGFDRSHQLRQTSGVRAFTDVTVAGLAESMVGRHGLAVAADQSGPRWPRVIQQGESDLELLSRVAGDAGLWWQLEGNDIRLRSWRPGENHQVSWGEDLFEAAVDSDATGQAVTIKTFGWDPVERAVWNVEASDSQAGRPGLGDQLLGGDGAFSLAGRICATSDIAEALAQSDLDFRTGAAGTIRAVVRGNLRWKPGASITIADQPADLAGPFLITAVEHLVDAFSGYVCVISSAPIPRPVRCSSGMSAVTLAVVMAVDDPDRAGRVRVRFPAMDDVESEWLPVLSLGAGEDKGLLCQPDAGDTVLVLHAMDDPGRGVVLGGLFADHLPGEAAGVSGQAVRRFGWNTSDGQRMVLNRDGDSVVISNGAGSRIELTHDAVLLHAEADLTIEAPGKKMVLRANTVDFERG